MSQIEKIAVLIATYNYFPYPGGVAVHVQEVARRLVTRGFNVTVLTVRYTLAEPSEEVIEGVRIIRLWTRPRLGKWTLGFSAAVRRIPFDLAHIQGIHTLFGAQACVRLARGPQPCLITPHVSASRVEWKNRFRPTQWRILGGALRRMKWMFFLTEPERQILQPYVTGQTVVVPNGSDLPHVATEVDENLIVSAGRLDAVKRHEEVIRAMPLVLAERPELRLEIVGAGEEEKNLQRLIDELNLGGSVKIVSFANTDREGLARKLRSTRLGVSFSSGENNPIMVQEFLMTGRPMLLAESNGLRSFVERGAAWGIRRDADTAALARAILDALDREPNFTPLDLPTWDDVTDRVEAAYRQCLGQTFSS